MSKIKVRWLWFVIGFEILAIAGILIWGLALRQPEKNVVQVPPPAAPPAAPVYNTPNVELVEVANGFAKPITIVGTGSSSDTRLFVVEQDGKIRYIKDGKPAAFLDISSKVKTGAEMGLLGLVFHPDLSAKPYFYINYIDKNQNTVIARYTLKSDGTVDTGSEKMILRLAQPYPNHNGGGLAFGPDGYLYIGLGDGGKGGDPQHRAQNPNELLGKMLRIDVNSGDPYSSPTDNMFPDGKGGRAEIWAMGLRNPWRFSFDRKTGDLYIADVGQIEWEEVNFQPAGAKSATQNYGWRCYEGSHDFKTSGCMNKSEYISPIIEYGHTEDRCSVTGGYVYRGTKFPALDGKYFYGDYCSGQLYYAEKVSGAWKSTLAAETGLRITTFGQDNTGGLFLASYKTGAIYDITDTANRPR